MFKESYVNPAVPQGLNRPSVGGFSHWCSGLSNSPAPIVSNASNAPTDIGGSPETNGVGTNRAIAVVFSTPWTLRLSTPEVYGFRRSGTVTYDVANKIAAFRPAADLTPSTMYQREINWRPGT